MNLKAHLQSISNLNESIDNLRKIAENLPDGNDKGYLLANIDMMQSTADHYTDEAIDLYDKIMNLAIGVS